MSLSEVSKKSIFNRYEGKCVVCEKKLGLPEDCGEIHHCFSQSLGGLDVPDNLALVCDSCHRVLDDRARKNGEFYYPPLGVVIGLDCLLKRLMDDPTAFSDVVNNPWRILEIFGVLSPVKIPPGTPSRQVRSLSPELRDHYC